MADHSPTTWAEPWPAPDITSIRAAFVVESIPCRPRLRLSDPRPTLVGPELRRVMSDRTHTIDAAGSYPLGPWQVRRIGYGAMQL